MISAIVYGDGETTEYDDLAAARDAVGTTWVHATEVTDAELDTIATEFDIHGLAIDDLRNDIRAKTEEFPDHTFVLFKTATLARGETTFREEVATSPVGIFLGEDWIVSVTPNDAPVVERVRKAVAAGDERLLHRGAAFTAYRILDVVVDDYFDLLDRIEDEIEAIEEDVLRPRTGRRSNVSTASGANCSPSASRCGPLARPSASSPGATPPRSTRRLRSTSATSTTTSSGFADLTETYRDLVSGARDIYLNALSQSTNEVMKVLTVVATIFIPLTFVAGVYGMNFDPAASPYNMPELGWRYGYPAVLIGMAAIGVAMALHFRRRGYI